MSQLTLLSTPQAIASPTHPMAKESADFLPKSAGRKQELFPFQTKMVRETYDLIRANEKRILWVAAPSAGKTRISGQVMIDATQRAKKPMRCAFVVEMDVLGQQTLETYEKLGLHATLYKADKKFDMSAQVVVISSQTLEQRVKKGQSVTELLGNFGLILGDEIHTLSQRVGWRLLNEAYAPSSTIFIGMTGTPWLEGDRSLYHHFDRMVCAPQPPELVKLGRLVIVRGFPPQDELFEDSALKWNAKDNDFDLAAQEDASISDQKLQLVLQEYQKQGEGRTAIAYCSGIRHAKLLTRTFLAAGVASEYQTGDTHPTERKAQHARMESGETKVLFSIGTCTKGYDAPFVSCIILARAIGKKNPYHQMSCRGNRAHTYPDGAAKIDCLLIDLGGNIRRFGHYPTDHQDYSAALMPPKRKQEATDDYYKTCPECGMEKILSFAKLCPGCGYEFGKGKDEEETLFNLADFQLKEFFTPLGSQQVQFVRSHKARYFAENINPDNVAKEFAAEFGFQPPLDWHLWAVFGRRSSKEQRARYHAYLQGFAPHQYWIDRHMRLEFGGEVKIPEFLAKWKDKWWDILGVDKTATMEQVKAAYLIGAKHWHPDVCSDLKHGTEQMQMLNVAYEEAKKLLCV